MITCANCHEQRPPARRFAVMCGECYAEIGRDMDAIARGETEPDGDDLFTRIERNHADEYKPSFGSERDSSAGYRAQMKDAGRGELLR